MLEGKELILATRQFAKEDRKKSWFYTITTLLMLMLSLTGTIINFHISLQIVCSILSGLLMIRMFAIYHDYLHEAILQHSTLAKAIFTFFGIYVLTPPSIWKRSHDYHHRNNSKLFSAGIGSYPIYTKSKLEKCNGWTKTRYLFIRHPATILCGYIFTFVYGMCIQSLMNNFKKHQDSLYALVLHFSVQLVVLFFFGVEELFLFVVLPHFISGALGAYLFYAQHNFPSVTFKGDEEWTYEGAALESSSYLELNPFLRWITASLGYHHIHHLNARIPFYRLAETMDHYKELQKPKKTTLMPGDIIACLKLKVWDYEKQQMTGLK